MELENITDITVQQNMTNGYAMKALFRDHHVALFCVCLCSLILGLPLVWNVLWHLKEGFSSY